MSTYTQTGPFKVTTPLGGDTLLFSALYGEEAVSTPFLFTVDMLSETTEIDGSQLLRQPITVELDMDGSTRYINGLVRRFTEMDVAYSGLYAYRAEIVPWLWFLSLATDCRVYENMSVLDIVEDVFSRNNWSAYSIQAQAPPKRQYCVQYRETDLAFVSRLLEEEGIFYFFQHTSSGHTLVLADNNSAFQQTPGPETVTTVQKVVGSSTYENQVGSLQFDQQVPAGTVTLYDYNYLDGQTPLKASESSTGPDEAYDYPGGFQDQSTGDNYARMRLYAAEAVQNQLSGAGTCRGFTSGYQFTLSDYFRNDLNGAWNIVRVRHTAQLGSYVGTDTGQTQAAKYVNDFTAIADSVVYRPLIRTPHPVIAGTQTALVVGPSGSEINVDQYARVQVQFFWERADKGDPGSTGWVRVATFWAGKQWGAIHIPRIGQEVVVAFEEGNPDRPIIVGSVYNPDMMPPYDLPGNKSQSGIKSRSTEGGGTDDYNEFRFEDKIGSEEILLHAQKDHTIEVENNRSLTIGNADTKVIDQGDYNELVKQGKYVLEIQQGDQEIRLDQGNQSTEILQGDCTLEIDQGKYTVTVAESDFDIQVGNNLSTVIQQGNDNKTVVKGDYNLFLGQGNLGTIVGQGDYNLNCQIGTVSINASLGSIKLNAMQGITLQCGANSIQITPTGVTISAMQVQISGEVQTQVSGAMVTVSGDAMTQISGAITMIG
jgi:type VI secretion system secreted protein VgrG